MTVKRKAALRCFKCRAPITIQDRWWHRLPDTLQLVPICPTCWSQGKHITGRTANG